MGAPISDFVNTPFATVVARVARVVGDGSDSDRAPDFLPASGEIVFTPNIKFSKLEVDNKTVIVLNEPVRCTIDPVTGYMIGPDGGFGVRLVASSGVNIEPQGLGYTVTFRGAETRVPDFSIFLEAGSVVDLAKILPVDLQPGIVTTVSSKTVDAVEQALIRLNSLQENVSYTVKSIPDMFRWDGTTLLINGNPGPDLGRITDEKLEDINNTIDSLAQAHSDLMNGYIETQHSFVELDDKLGQAFPDDIFDVGAALGAVEVDVLAQAALDAQGMATAAQQAAITAAQDFAAGKISEAELRAANDAKAKADAARDAAIEAADLDATSKAGQALAGAQAYADAQATAAEVAAKTHATNEAARVKQEALTEAATDAQAKAAAAAEAAEAAAKTYALAQAQGLSGKALEDAKADAQAKADAARDAAIAAAETYADARKNEAINAAALTAQAKADVAKQAAIDAAKADLDALEIGGRNLALNSKAGWETTTYAVTGTQNLSEPWIVGETYTVTVKGEVNEGQTFRIWRDNGWMQFGSLTHVGNGIHRVTAEAGDTTRENKAQFAIYNYPSSGAEYAHIEWIKIERGSKATDWTPAPEDVDAGIADAHAVATSAMTTADGKNTTSYKTVTTTPGAAPTNAVEGKNRRQFDMHRNRLSNGTIVGEWMWSGSSWVQVHMGDGILRSLDVGKLTAGTANIQTAVINKVWGQLGVFDKLDVRTDAYVSGINLKDGAVTARTLNVVPEMGQGGLQLTPDGMMLIDSEGSGTVDLRVNADNYLSFYRDGSVNFSVSDDGALSAQSVSANDGLFYRGVELMDFLESMPRGVVYYAEPINGNHTISNASYTSRIGHIAVDRPSTARHWRIVARAGVQSSASGGNDTSGAHWQFVSNGGRVYNQDTWTVLASVLYQTSGYYWQTETLEHVVNTDDISWNSAGQALISWTAKNAIGSSYKLGQGAYFYIEDVGPAFDQSPTYPWIRPEVSGDTGSSTKPTSRTSTWNMSSFQNYRAGVRVNHASGNLAGGNYSGEWRGIMFFPHATIKSALSGATTTKVEIYLQNAHTYAYSGSTILIGSHNYASAPSSSPSVAARASQHFSRGQGRWVTLPNAVGDGFKGGTIKGLAVYGSSTANYATWSPSAPKLRITYKK